MHASLRQNLHTMPALTFHVDNLKCGGCANTIRHELGELPGVGTVDVDPDAGTVLILHDGTATADEMGAVLHRLGYPERGKGGLKEKAVSYLSCAVGRFRGED